MSCHEWLSASARPRVGGSDRTARGSRPQNVPSCRPAQILSFWAQGMSSVALSANLVFDTVSVLTEAEQVHTYFGLFYAKQSF